MPSSSKERSRAPDPTDAVAALLHELTLHDDASELRQFVDLCRGSLRLRTWLFSRFAPEPETQQKFRALLKDPGTAPAGLWSPLLEAEVKSNPPRSVRSGGPYGGLSEPAIWRATLDHWAAIVESREGQPARELMHAVAFFHGRKSGLKGPGTASVDSWKVHVLFYILDHPRPSYRVSDLFKHLSGKFRRLRANGNAYVSFREIRRFCERHGINRDRRPGAPRRTPV